jgi:hypothetical protein
MRANKFQLTRIKGNKNRANKKLGWSAWGKHNAGRSIISQMELDERFNDPVSYPDFKPELVTYSRSGLSFGSLYTQEQIDNYYKKKNEYAWKMAPDLTVSINSKKNENHTD